MRVYGEKVISDWLRQDAGVQALGARVVGKTPRDDTDPWVRVTQIGAPQEPGSPVDHLVEFVFQFDAYAGVEGGQPEANLLARTVRAALAGIEDGTHHEGAVVSGARIVDEARVPDDDFKPSRERFVMTAIMWAHP